MPEETVIRQCAPTLAGIKTGSLFSCQFDDKNQVMEEIRQFNKKFVSRGLCLIPMRFDERRVLLYLYRPAGLRKDLQDEMARQVLEQEGYPLTNSNKCIARLIRRLQRQQQFPHEIGLFLSYPPEDVIGFINNNAGNYKYCGTWKVYGDVNRALDTFARYRKCTESYLKRWSEGVNIEKLAVSC